VDVLERLLEQAKAGELVSIACAAEMTDRCTLSSFAYGEDADFGKLVHAIERVKLRILLRNGVDEV